MSKVLVLSDLHCGHLVGLTPKDWRVNRKKCDLVPVTKRDKFAALQGVYWDFYASTVRKHGPWDAVIVNGDAIDGPGSRSGGTEQITVDREEQCLMATFAIKLACNKRTKVVMTYGTSYHTGDSEDWEQLVAHSLGAEKIGAHEWVDVCGTIFDVKHHVGASGVPHGRHTAVARDRLWNQLWSERGGQPKSSVVIRSHVHYHSFCGGPDWLAMTTPALQGLGTKYGSRRCSGMVDFGLVAFDVGRSGYTWKAFIADLPVVAPKTVRI